ncbi:MAG TPA: DNA-binding domain-containing protein [Burkholderiaceae bacterium]|nr:DNA-binding domain-containing protein [Burkholderiaceae bacterium]
MPPIRAPHPTGTPPLPEPGLQPNPGAGGALYIGSVNLTPPPVQPAARRAAQPGAGSKRPAIESRTAQALAEDFMQWLREGIATRTLQINTPQSALHFTDSGMVLVYPAIFQAYAGVCAAPAIKGPGSIAERAQVVLHAVCDLGWHESGPFDSRLLHFELLQHRAEPAILKGVVIQSPQRFINPLPPPNPALSRLI